jgi:hypothetical protein
MAEDGSATSSVERSDGEDNEATRALPVGGLNRVLKKWRGDDLDARRQRVGLPSFRLARIGGPGTRPVCYAGTAVSFARRRRL